MTADPIAALTAWLKAWRERRDRRSVRYPSARWETQRALLDASTEAEAREYLKLRLPAPHGATTAAECQAVTEKILKIRTERVAILRSLGWDDPADRLETDTRMRWSWVNQR